MPSFWYDFKSKKIKITLWKWDWRNGAIFSEKISVQAVDVLARTRYSALHHRFTQSTLTNLWHRAVFHHPLSSFWSFLQLCHSLFQVQAMMKTMSTGNCTLNVPAKNSYRMVVLGASRVGKSSIVSRFLNGRFEDQYTPTIEDFHRKVYNIRGDMYQLDILDTSGNHPFPAMRRLSILTGEKVVGESLQRRNGGWKIIMTGSSLKTVAWIWQFLRDKMHLGGS